MPSVNSRCGFGHRQTGGRTPRRWR
jgi:hypothetical protein